MPAERPWDWHIWCPVSNITSGCFSNRILLHLDRQKQTRQVICVQMCLLLSVSPDKIFRVILVCRRLLPSYTSAVCICAVFQSHWCPLFIQCCQTRSSFLLLWENHWTVRKHWHLSLRKCGIKLSKECLSGYAKFKRPRGSYSPESSVQIPMRIETTDCFWRLLTFLLLTSPGHRDATSTSHCYCQH